MFSLSSEDIYWGLWLIVVCVFLGLIGARELGYWFHRRRLRKGLDPIADGFTLNTVLALLALLVGFTFSMSLNRYDARRELVVEEANAIGTTWLRVQLLDENARAELNPILRAYVAERVAYGNSKTDEAEEASYARAAALQNRLWQAMGKAIEPIRTTPLSALVVATTNETFDLAASRKAARASHVPHRVLVVMLIYALIVGILVGHEKGRYRWATTLLFMLLTLATALIIDLDQPSRGAIKVSQQPISDVQAAMLP
jgi:hypothetical protein